MKKSSRTAKKNILTCSWKRINTHQRSYGWLQLWQTFSSYSCWGMSDDYWPDPKSEGDKELVIVQDFLYQHNEEEILISSQTINTNNRKGYCNVISTVICLTYRINAKRIRTSENACDIGVQRQIPITFESLLSTHRQRLSEYARSLGLWWIDVCVCVCVFVCVVRPVVVFCIGPDVPSWGESVEAPAETLVVNGSGIDRKQPHQQNEISASKHHLPDLTHKRPQEISTYIKIL